MVHKEHADKTNNNASPNWVRISLYNSDSSFDNIANNHDNLPRLTTRSDGDNFLQGALNGFQIGLLNHAMHDDGFGITYYHDKDGNQCGTISEIVVTPSDKTDLFAVSETANTVVGSVGSSLKNNAGNSTWGSNYKLYWHAKGEQGFYGNQYVKTMNLVNIGRSITKYTGIAGKVVNGIDIYYGYKEDESQIGYYTLRAGASAAGGYVGGLAGVWAGGLAGAKIGAIVGTWFGVAGAVPGAIIGGAIGGAFLSEGGSWGGEKAFELLY